jgi:hypothetical protein
MHRSTGQHPVGFCHLSWRALSLSVARIVNYSVNLQGGLKIIMTIETMV